MSKLFKKYLFGIVAIALIAVIVLALTIFQSRYDSNMRKPPKYLKEITRLTKLNFPPTVQWVGHNLDRGMEYYWETKFLIPKRDIDNLFGDIKGEWKSDVRYIVNSISGRKWFDPDSVQIYKSIDAYYPTEFGYIKVLYDNSKTNDDDLIVCYLVWFELS